jgi:5-methylcytosine-specific restriction endonuclease McrBC regulatory subunit McrC
MQQTQEVKIHNLKPKAKVEKEVVVEIIIMLYKFINSMMIKKSRTAYNSCSENSRIIKGKQLVRRDSANNNK